MNDPLDQKLSAHFKARKTTAPDERAFARRVLTALPPVEPLPLTLYERVRSWDNGTIAAVVAVAVLLCIPFGGNASALDVAGDSISSLTGWLATSPVGIAVAATLAIYVLFGEDDELIPEL